MNEYIKLRKGKYYIRNDLGSFILFYDYFLFRIKLFPYAYKLINPIFKSFITLIFKLRLNKLFITHSLEDNSLVIRKPNGNKPSVVKLVKKDNKYYIQKFNSKKLLMKELIFYKKYRDNNSKIKLLNLESRNDHIELKFLQKNNLLKEILEGNFSKLKLERLIENFLKELDKLYGEKIKCLIHGDLGLSNIFLDGEDIILIDYSDSEIYYRDYDKYIFLKKLFKYSHIDLNKLNNYFSKGKIKQFENHHRKKNELKHK